MSIILKALKKAEETKTEKELFQDKSYSYISKDSTKIILLVMLFVVLVGVFFVWNFFFKDIKSPIVQTTKLQPISQPTPEKIQLEEKKEILLAPKPEDTAKLIEDSLVMLKSDNYSGAESGLRRASFLKPDNAVIYNHLGLALKKQGKYKEAAVEYARAIQLKPDYYEAMNNLAVTQEMLGDTAAAKVLYKKALSVKPSYAEAHLNYALLLESENNEQEAVSHYHTFLNLSSDEAVKKKVSERLRRLKK
ncbi:MAG: tetratricopeptide repeat protein [Nitrospiraceae bacterium]|nr:tetratricopeptide repeat protein [Nitrospiraceae bacterium]